MKLVIWVFVMWGFGLFYRSFLVFCRKMFILEVIILVYVNEFFGEKEWRDFLVFF